MEGQTLIVDYAEQIKQSVTMPEVAAMYGLTVNRSHKAICPFHEDKKPSMHVYPGRRGYFCYVCGKGGDVITFTERLFGLTFQDAMKKLNGDFRLGLPIGAELDEDARKEAARIAYQRRKEQERKKKRHEALLTAYHSALDEWIRLDSVIREEAPETPFDGFTEAYADAVKHIDFAGYKLDAAERELYEFEKGIA